MSPRHPQSFEERKIVLALHKAPGRTRPEYAKMTGLGVPTVRYVLLRLARTGKTYEYRRLTPLRPRRGLICYWPAPALYNPTNPRPFDLNRAKERDSMDVDPDPAADRSRGLRALGRPAEQPMEGVRGEEETLYRSSTSAAPSPRELIRSA